MKTLGALLLLALTACCTITPVHDRLRAATVRLEFVDGVCSGTAIGPQEILTAAHCIESKSPMKIDGVDVNYTVKQNDGKDHVVLTVNQVRKVYARIGGAPEVGDVVFIWGQPLGLENVLRYGRVAGKRGEATLFDMRAIQGDSGAAVFNHKGEVVAVISGIWGNDAFLLAVAYPLELK